MADSLAGAVADHSLDVRQRPALGIAVSAAAWLALLVAMLATRPLLPVDETRYASVAWEMWRSGDFLVPHLNGRAYSDKPPLLFWLVNAGWSVLGPVEYWARLVGPLAAAASLALTAVLARRLWPEQESPGLAAAVVLAGTLAWSVYGTLLLFDALLTACVLVALIGLIEARRGRARGFALFALGVGFGVLAKGPVIFIHVLPAAMTARWWDTAASARARRWPLALGAAVLGGVLIALAWAIPAAVAGGEAYGRAIFVGQTSGRLVRSFAHRRPFWWYVPQLLWMTLPWLAWPTFWRRVRASRLARRMGERRASDGGLRFCAVWAVGAFVAFTLVSGKQVHYLLPELPAFALVVARVVLAARSPSASAPADAGSHLATRMAVIATGTLLVVTAAHLVAAPTLEARYDPRDVATHLAAAESNGAPIAHEGRYAGEFTFLGRLERPIAEVPADSIADWLGRHPRGLAVTYASAPLSTGAPGVELVRRYRGRYIIVRRQSPSMRTTMQTPP